MLAYAVSAALHSGLFAEVVVSSDDPAIGRIAESYGAVFMLRPSELASDSAQLVDVARHVLDVLRAGEWNRMRFASACPTVRWCAATDILAHWSIFRSRERRFQISVVPYRGVYPHWAIVADDEQIGRWLLGDERYLVRSQDLPRTFCPTGAIWWARTADFLAQNAFYGSPFHLAPMDANRGIDIDDEQDLQLAELLVHGLTGTRR